MRELKKTIFVFCNQLHFSLFHHSGSVKPLHINHFHSRPGECGLASAAMVLKFFNKSSSYSKLKAKYSTAKFYDQKLGWKYSGLIQLLADFNIKALHHKHLPTASLLRLLKHKQPIIISIYNPKQHSGHLCLLTGHNQKAVTVQDPQEKTKNKGKVSISFSQFNQLYSGNCITFA